MFNGSENQEIKCSNICVGRGDLLGQPKFMSIRKEKHQR